MADFIIIFMAMFCIPRLELGLGLALALGLGLAP